MNRVVPFSLLTCVCSAAIAGAQLSDVQQASFAEQLRRSMGLEATVAKVKAGKVDAKRLAIIHAVLSATHEVHVHRQRGASGNSVYLDPSGHREAVYGPDGRIVADGINDGSYNYFNPTNDALRHYFFDTHPWILMGNARTDPTTVRERLSSFMADLEDGILQAAKAGKFPAIDVRRLRDGEPETYAIFLNSLQAGDANELFAAIESQDILNDNVRSAMLRKVEAALRKIYAH
jgi:hypothetical protein